MIWHVYNNNEKYIMTDSPHENYQNTPTLSTLTDEDSCSSSAEENDSFVLQKKSYVSPDSKSLFLNFAPDLNIKSKNKKSSSIQKSASVKVNGVNILNRKNLDSKTIADRIQKRKENHNILERRRRDCINNTILEISRVLPLPGEQKSNKYSILQSALAYIMSLKSENESIKKSLNRYSAAAAVSSSFPSPIPSVYEPNTSINYHHNDYHYHHIKHTTL